MTSDNGTTFVALAGFGMLASANTTYYYVADYAGSKIIIYDDNWKFIRYVSMSFPAFMITIGSNLYITCDSFIAITDGNLKILSQYNGVGTPLYRGIYYNSTNDLIYVVSRTRIFVFNLNLALNDSFTILPNLPYSITGYNNQLFVGTYGGSIFVIVNKLVVNSFNSCNGNSALVSSFLFDQYGSIAALCYASINYLYLYLSNGTYANKNLLTPTGGEYIGFDSKGRFLVISDYQINIYF